jgi:integrase
MGGIKIDKGKPKLEYLTNTEIESILRVNHPSSAINKAKDLFVFQLNSGLSYGDLMEVQKTDIQFQNGSYIIKKKRIKTGVDFTAVLLPQAIEILEKYNYQLPKITNQRYNIYLKDIQQMAGVETTLTTHLARKTYATHLLNKGVPLNVVSKLLGHSNTNITQRHYAKTIDDTVISAVQAVM